MDLGLSPAHTADKLKSIITPATRAVGLTDNPNGLTYRHCIKGVTAKRLSEAKSYSDYFKNSEFETINVFERENISGTQLNENIQMTRQDQNIQTTLPDQNIPLTRLNQNIPVT